MAPWLSTGLFFISDCCDGSDEHDGRTQHVSTCTVLAEAHEQARVAIEKGVNEGHKIYKEYIESLKRRQLEEQLAAQKAAQEKLEEESEKRNTTHGAHNETQPDSVESVPSEPHEESADIDAEVKESEIRADRPNEEIPVDDQKKPNENPSDESGSTSSTPSQPPTPIDYGPEGGFRMLLENPGYLEFTDKQYVYRFYPFDKIYQRNKDNDWSPQDTSLGRWSGWSYAETDLLRENKYAIMMFENGLGCWNGPARSVKVFVHCDARNEIRSVEEPSRCVYTMELRTPAACFESPEEPYALPLGFSDILLYAVTTLFVFLITRRVLRSTSRSLCFGRDTIRGKLPSVDGSLDIADGEPKCCLSSSNDSIADQVTNAADAIVTTPLEKKKALKLGLDLLSEEEKEEETSVRAAQLSAIFKLIQAQPGRFGDMSLEDMSNQFQKFYVRSREEAD
ncbi:Glucosidase II beta subunit [Fasciola hepatica]|uniref:Glucosidase II beta subunit n=1 Tax=Fasciola hepatica TaxID=6192 RepID=A0A4E0R3F5_FASHE|nr:Glucosidase II beta subunit [Fasciola hepatica]